MMRIVAAIGIMIGLIAAAAAYQYPMVPYVSGTGPMAPGLIGPMVPNTPGEPPPPNPCTGAADFSDGCAVAVFGH